jgi:hypothetical protein
MSILHLNNFGLAMHKKNQGSVQKRKPKRNTMIKPSQQSSRISGIKGSLAPGRNLKNTMLQLSKVWSLQESLSRVKEMEGNTLSISCRRKETLKESQAGQNRLLLQRQGNNTLHSSCTYHVFCTYLAYIFLRR